MDEIICSGRHNDKGFLMETKIAIFPGRGIRKTLHENEWWFSVGIIVEVPTDTTNSKDYIKKIRKRDGELYKR